MDTQSPWRSALVSTAFTAWTILAVLLAFAVADNAVATPAAFAAWLGSHWWPVLIGLLINPAPIYRARQSITNAQKGT